MGGGDGKVHRVPRKLLSPVVAPLRNVIDKRSQPISTPPKGVQAGVAQRRIDKGYVGPIYTFLSFSISRCLEDVVSIGFQDFKLGYLGETTGISISSLIGQEPLARFRPIWDCKAGVSPAAVAQAKSCF